MKKFVISGVFGIVGVVVFLLGAASSSGGVFKVFAFPALIFQSVSNAFGFSINEVQMNQGGVIVQFMVYFALAFMPMLIIESKRKHNKALQSDAAEPRR